MATDSKDKLRHKLIGYIEDAWALENQIIEVLEKQDALTASYPELNQKIKQHLAETQVQRRRMAERLEAYNRTPNPVKGVVSDVMGNMLGLTGALRRDAISRVMRDDYVTEHLEIAGYTLLIDTARLVGDEETVKAAQATLKEEIAMQTWLAAHLQDGLVVDFKAENIEVPAAELPAVPKLKVTFEPVVPQQTT